MELTDDAERRPASQPPHTGGLPGWRRPQQRITHAYRNALGPRQRSALVTWAAFTTTFAVVRGITYSIKYHVGPLHDVKMGNTHLHHYVWGIALVSAAGGVAVYGDSNQREHPAVGALYGTGLALVVDELALLLELRDVYWQRQGRWSIDAAACLSGLTGSYFAGTEFWRHLFRRPGRLGGAELTQPAGSGGSPGRQPPDRAGARSRAGSGPGGGRPAASPSART